MHKNLRTSIVALIASAVGAVLGQVADAQPPTRAPAPAFDPSDPYAPAPSGAAIAPAAAAVHATGAAGELRHEEGDPPDPAATPASPQPAPALRGAAPKATILRTTVPAKDGMLRLPGGRFMMGAGYGPRNERPLRHLSVAPFWMDRTEVTVGEYRACVEKGACTRPAKTSVSCTYDLGDPQLPVSCVHWRDADAFCRASSKRLPSEAEWEFAARGTMSVPFPWGGAPGCGFAVTMVNEMPDKSCAARPMGVGTHPSGASMFGVQDMTGNVEEWTADWYVELVGAGPAPRSGASHVLRGGGWLSNPSVSRTTTRNWGSAIEAGPNVGFRCARND